MFNQRQHKILKTFFDKHPSKVLWKGDAAEFVTQPTPLTQSIIFNIVNKQDVWQQALRHLNCPLPLHFTDEYVKVLLHHAYIDLEIEATLFGFGNSSEWEIVDDFSKPKSKVSFFQSLMHPRYLLWQANVLQPDKLTNLLQELKGKEGEFCSEFQKRESNTFEQLVTEFGNAFTFILSIGFIDGLCQQYFEEMVKHEELEVRAEYESYLSECTQANDEYFQSLDQLHLLKNDQESIDTYLKKYGNRSFDDYELASPRYWEIPEKIKQIVLSSNSGALEKRISSKREKISVKHKKLLQVFGQVKGMRGSFRLHILALVNEIRVKALLVAKERNISSELVFFMNLAELIDTPAKIAEQDLMLRKQDYEEDIELQLPMILTAKNWDKPLMQTEKLESMNVLAISKGDIVGIIEHVTSELQQVTNSGRILVFPDSSAKFTHLYPRAQGIIFMQGGIMSHGAIIAREYHIPAVSLGGKQIVIRDGQKVQLNATTGKIVVLS